MSRTLFVTTAIFCSLFSCKPAQEKTEVTPKDTATQVSPQANERPAPADTVNSPVFNTAPISNTDMVTCPIQLRNGMSFNLAVLKGYKIYVAAEGLERLRFLALSPDGRLFATDMHDRSDNKKGRILIFENWNADSSRFLTIRTYLSNLHNPNQVLFHNGFIYIAETGKLSRIPFKQGDVAPSGTAEILATFPDYGLGYKYGGWHLTRSLATLNNKLYVSIGSSCNACIEKEEERASIMEMDFNGSNKRIFARGLRNSVGIKNIEGTLWATSMGRDLIGADKPEDLFLQVKSDGYYGWPFYYQYKGKVYADEHFKDSVRAGFVTEPPFAFTGFAAHAAPLGLEYFKNFDDDHLRNAVLVCLHGSTTVSRQRGNAVVKVLGSKGYTNVVSGFLQGTTEAQRFGRPCDVMMRDAHSFYITDDKNGVLYLVSKI